MEGRDLGEEREAEERKPAAAVKDPVWVSRGRAAADVDAPIGPRRTSAGLDSPTT